MKKFINYLRGIYGPQTVVINPKTARKVRKMKQKYNTLFFLTIKVVKHPQVVKDLSNKFVEIIPQLTETFNKMSANEGGYFTVGPTNPTLAQFETLIQELAQCEQDLHENKPNALENRDAKWSQTYIALRGLISYVYFLTVAKPDHAAQIASEAAMRLNIPKGRTKQQFTAKSVNDTEIEITGQVKKHGQFNDWQVCLDPSNEKNWLLIKVTPTRAANTTVTGLTSGSYYYVRHMAINTGEPNVWTEPIRVKVK